MPITVQYGPIALAGGLATMAGQAEAQKTAFQQSLQSGQLALAQTSEANRARAQDRAFELQKAQADRLMAEQTRTPAADHVAEKADIERADAAKEKAAFQKQLDAMLADGTIDQSQYQKGTMAYLTGNKTLMNQILAAPKAEKPNISNAEEVDAIRQPFRERRRSLEQQLQAANKGAVEALTSSERDTALKQQKDTQAKIDAEFAGETAALDKWRKEGRGQLETPPAEGRVPQLTRGPDGQIYTDMPTPVGLNLRAPTGQPLTPDIARALLQEANGDKEKARQLARDRGYIF
jgi:hypothetical protein